MYIGFPGEKRPLVFQSAQPWTVDDAALQAEELKKLGQKMADSCGTTFDDQPKKLPEHIPYGSIKVSKNGCALGLALDGSGVVGIFSDQNTAVLTLVGVNAALCSSVSAMIINQAAQSGRYESEYTVADSVDAIPALEKIRASIKADNQNRYAQKKYLLVIYDLPKVYRNLPDEQRTLLDKFILHGGSKLGIDCLFTAEPNQLAELPDNDGGVIPASVSLFRRPMLYLDLSLIHI